MENRKNALKFDEFDAMKGIFRHVLGAKKCDFAPCVSLINLYKFEVKTILKVECQKACEPFVKKLRCDFLRN